MQVYSQKLSACKMSRVVTFLFLFRSMGIVLQICHNYHCQYFDRSKHCQYFDKTIMFMFCSFYASMLQNSCGVAKMQHYSACIKCKWYSITCNYCIISNKNRCLQVLKRHDRWHIIFFCRIFDYHLIFVTFTCTYATATTPVHVRIYTKTHRLGKLSVNHML